MSVSTLTLVKTDIVATQTIFAANVLARFEAIEDWATDVKSIAGTSLQTTGNQTITAGVKTFVVSPIVPTPTTDYQPATKKYVDDAGYAKFVDSKATTTDGGTFTSGSWTKRTVTEESDVGGHVSVSSSVIVLDAGTYQVRISCPAYKVDEHQARLRNTTSGSTLLVGTAQVSAAVDNSTAVSVISGLITVAGLQNLEIQHKCGTTKTSTGFGLASDQGEAEIYTVAEFWKR